MKKKRSAKKTRKYEEYEMQSLIPERYSDEFLSDSPGTVMEPQEDKLTFWSVCTLCYIMLGNLAAGMCLGALNSPGDFIKSFMNETSVRRGNGQMTRHHQSELYGLLTGIFAIGAGFSAALTQKMADFFGRKRLLAASAFFNLASALIMSMCVEDASYEQLFVGRAMSGLVAGVTMAVCPVYMAEILPRRYLGAALVVNNHTVGFGVALASILGYEDLFATKTLWPIIVGAHGASAVVQLLLIPCVVPSPHYLLVTSGKEMATLALKRLRGRTDEENLLDELLLAKYCTGDEHEMSVLQLLMTMSLWRPLLVSIMGFVSQQFTGIVIAVFYTVDMLKKVGLSTKMSRYVSTGVTATGNLVTLTTVFLVNRLERRCMMLSGLTGMLISNTVLSVTLIYENEIPLLKFVGIACLPFLTGSHSFGPSQVPWLMVTELFESNCRGAASSICVMVLWFSLFFVGYAFPPLEDRLGPYAVLPFVVLTIFFIVFFYFLQPETLVTEEDTTTIIAPTSTKRPRTRRQYDDYSD